jgi:hypothetical protein
VGGCGAPPASVTTNLDLGSESHRGDPAVVDEASQDVLLSVSEQAEILDALRDSVAGGRPVNLPGPARGGLRWSDVEVAVDEAVSEIEATIVRTLKAEDGNSYRFEIRTIESYPGEVVVRRVGGRKLYELDIRIGRFPSEPDHVQRAEKLHREIDQQMKRLGAQRWFPEGTEP